MFIRVDACYIKGFANDPGTDTGGLPGIKVRDNSSSVAIVNNYFETANAGEELSLDAEDDGISALLVAHNTFGSVLSGVALRDNSDSTSVSSIAVKNNLFVIANQGNPGDLYFKRDGGGLTGYSIDQNAWTSTNAFVWDVNGDLDDFTEWNARPQVGTDVLTNTALDVNLRPTSPTIVSALPGVFEDYYGNPRTVVWAGAVGPVPPPPP